MAFLPDPNAPKAPLPYGPIRAYYRDSKKKLKCIYTEAYYSDVEIVMQEILSQLHDEQEVFFKPILLAMNGGKRD